MQKGTLFAIAFLAVTTACAQQTAVKLSLNTNLFSFSGPTASDNSYIIFNSQSAPAYTNNPYGSKNGVGYGFSANIQHVTKGGFIVGTEVGYERAASTLDIKGINGNITYNGKTRLNYNFINMLPFVGYQFNAGKVDIDMTAGFEFAYCLKATEKADANTSSGGKYTTERDRKTIKTDVRPHIQLSADYKNIGVFVGYSHGLANYLTGYVGGSPEAYARLFRFGITYQVKQWQRKGK